MAGTGRFVRPSSRVSVCVSAVVLYGLCAPSAPILAELRGQFYSVTPAGTQQLLPTPSSADPPDTLDVELLVPDEQIGVGTVDFGLGTELVSGDGTLLDRSGSAVNPFGGIGIDVGTDNMLAVFTGTITVPETATYRFTTRSDDGSVLYVDGVLVVDNNFNQGPTNRSGDVVLGAGAHTVKLGYFDGGGGAAMQWSWEQLDGANPFARRIVEADVLSSCVDDGSCSFAPITPCPSTTPIQGAFWDLDSTDPALLVPTADPSDASDRLEVELQAPTMTRRVERVDFGLGTEGAPGDGTVLDRNGSSDNIFGGVLVDAGTDFVAAIFTATLNAPESATYRFTLRSDDGSVLYVDGALVVDNNFFQGATNRSGEVMLAAGPHGVKVGYFDANGGAAVQWSWEQIDGANPFGRRIVEPAALVPLPPDDLDGDGLPDICDSCLDVADPDQLDIDLDGQADACEDTHFNFEATSSSDVEGTGPVTFRTVATVLRTGNADGEVSVDVARLSGTATAGDYVDVLPVTVTFPDQDKTPKEVQLEIFGDASFEVDETLVLELAPPVDGIIDSPSTTTYTILDDDNGPPTVVDAAFQIAENSAVATVVGTVTATDPDATTVFAWSIESGNTGGAFVIESATGEITVASEAPIDFETNPTFDLLVRATDNGVPPLFGQETITVTVINVEEPVAATPDADATDEDTVLVVADPGVLGNDIDPDGLGLTVTASDVTSASGAVVSVGVGGGFTYDPRASATLQALGAGESVFDTFEYTVTDAGGTTATTTVTVTVSGLDVGLTLSKESLVGGDVRLFQPFSFRLTALNEGPGAAGGVIVEDPLPPQLEFVSSSCAGHAAGLVTWSIGTLSAFTDAACDIVVRPIDLGPVLNEASVSSDDDPEGIPITASATVQVEALTTAVPTLSPLALILLASALALLALRVVRR